MKKTRLLIATLVCAVMLMGVGYAWWTDSVAIGSTVATGNMDVHFENGDYWPFVYATEYVQPSIVTATDKEITCKFDNLYPGALGVIDTLVKNDSTIPVKLANASIAVTADSELAPYLKAYAYYYKVDANGNYVNNSFGWTDLVALDQLANELNSKLANMELLPGEKLYFGIPEGEEGVYDLDQNGEKENCIVLYVDPSAGNDTQNKDASFTLTLNWKQFNQW